MNKCLTLFGLPPNVLGIPERFVILFYKIRHVNKYGIDLRVGDINHGIGQLTRNLAWRPVFLFEIATFANRFGAVNKKRKGYITYNYPLPYRWLSSDISVPSFY